MGKGGKQNAKRRIPWLLLFFILITVLELAALAKHDAQSLNEEDWKQLCDKALALKKPINTVVVGTEWLRPHLQKCFASPSSQPTLELAAIPDEALGKNLLIAVDHGATLLSTPTGSHQIEDFIDQSGASPFFERKNIALYYIQNQRGAQILLSSKLQELQVREGNSPCTRRSFATKYVALGQGPSAPASHFSCTRGNWVGRVSSPDGRLIMRNAIYAKTSANQKLALTLPNFQGKKTLWVAGGATYNAYRNKDDVPYQSTIAIKIGDKTLATLLFDDPLNWSKHQVQIPDNTLSKALTLELSSPDNSSLFFDAGWMQ